MPLGRSQPCRGKGVLCRGKGKDSSLENNRGSPWRVFSKKTHSYNTEFYLCGDTLKMIHPSLYLTLTITLLPSPRHQKAVAEALCPSQQRSQESYPDSMDSRTNPSNHI